MMKPTKTVQAHLAPLLGFFLNAYEPLRQKMPPACQRPLLDVAPLAFSKWYYTALASDTILSPANVVGNFLHGAQEDTEYAYVLRPTPQEDQNIPEYPCEYSFSLYSYSTKEHPLIDDLQALLDYCRPARTADAEGLLLKEEQAAILDQLSFKTDFYLEYLTRLAWMHGLLVYLPAIHTKRMQPSEDCDTFFSQSTAEMLFQLGQTACQLASERFIASMDVDSAIAAPDFFYSCLQSDKEVDCIFIDFYKRVDVDIEKIWETPPEELNAEEHSIVSSFLFTGIMLEKWFLTPMGAFFHFIRPIAYIPIRFFSLVNTLAALVLMERNLGAELFTPSTYYSLTPLGEELFADPDIELRNRQQLRSSIPYEQILSALEFKLEYHAQQMLMQMEIVPDVLSMRVSYERDTDFWKEIECTQDMALHTFCMDLAATFYAEQPGDYLLSVPDSNGFPVDYSAKGSKRSINKTDGKLLQDLPLHTGMVLTLYPAAGKTKALRIEILEKGKGNPFQQYPRIPKQSKKVVEHEKFDETF